MKQTTMGLMLALALGLAACGKQESAKPADATAQNETAKAGQTAEAPKGEAPKGEAPKEVTEKAAAVIDVNDPNVVKISVPTMQCETCAKTITKGVKDVPEAQDVNVDVDTKTVFVKVSNNTPETQRKLEEAISKVGYSTTAVKRDPAAYKGLPECCQESGSTKM